MRGRVLKELNLRRTDLIITTKIFFGVRSGPNATGLSRKQYVRFEPTEPCLIISRMACSIIEGTKESLERLQLDYVDVIFAHRPDSTGGWRALPIGRTSLCQ